MVGDKTATCKKCHRKYEVVRDESKGEKDPEAYSFVYNPSIVDFVGKISLFILIGASVIMIIFALYAKHKMTDGLEDNTGGYTLHN